MFVPTTMSGAVQHHFIFNSYNPKGEKRLSPDAGADYGGGIMKRDWAIQYSYLSNSYSHKGIKCQTPGCPATGVKNLILLEHNMSGDVVKIGEQCYGRWRDLMGYPRSEKFNDYLEALKKNAVKLNGRQLSPAEIIKIKREHDKKWLQKEGEKGNLAPKDIPLYWGRPLRRECRKAWCQRQVEEGKLKLEPFYQPMENFKTFEEADKWAEENGGYYVGVKTRNGKSHWFLYINPFYKGEY